MKTKRSTFKSIVSMSFLAFFVLVVQSCVVEVPPEDPDPPTFSFRVVGDGFDHTFTENTNFNNITLMLRYGVTYEFTFFGEDEGGMEYMGWLAAHLGHMEVNPNLHGEWNFSDSTGASSLEWLGNPNDPLSGSIIAGTFTTQGDVVTDGTFQFMVRDYGGESGRSNRISENLSVFFGAHTTRIRDD